MTKIVNHVCIAAVFPCVQAVHAVAVPAPDSGQFPMTGTVVAITSIPLDVAQAIRQAVWQAVTLPLLVAFALAQFAEATLHLAMFPLLLAPLNAPVMKRITIAAIANTAAIMIKYSNAPCAFLIISINLEIAGIKT